jgi:hypothetical protein
MIAAENILSSDNKRKTVSANNIWQQKMLSADNGLCYQRTTFCIISW